MGLEVNHEKTRFTKLTEGFDFIGYQFVKRRSPNTGKWTMYIFPSKNSQCNRGDRQEGGGCPVEDLEGMMILSVLSF